ncbi:hypothetical protein QAD02_006213 [Eretmocerus hayati]|uniref:Uncharacterized protein n=1 Tax=Eretmocerus hayati TaxID=131215 RepID=A0ACC2N0M9_9HYME|nr:hypothetical protein QAD02_006213 [Eretmocerus hayati]
MIFFLKVEIPQTTVTNDSSEIVKEVARAAVPGDSASNGPQLSDVNGDEENSLPSVPAPSSVSEPEINTEVPLEIDQNDKSQENMEKAIDDILTGDPEVDNANKIDGDDQQPKLTREPEASATNRVPSIDELLVTDSGLDAPVTFICGDSGVRAATESVETTTFSDQNVIEVIPNTTESLNELAEETEIIPTTGELTPNDDLSKQNDFGVLTTTESAKFESSSINKQETPVPSTIESDQPESSSITTVATTATLTTEALTSMTESTKKPEVTSTTTEAPEEMTVSVKVITGTDAPKPSTFTKDRINFYKKTEETSPWNKLLGLVETAIKLWKEPDQKKVVNEEGISLIHYAEEVYNEIYPYGNQAITEFSAVYDEIKKKLEYLATNEGYASSHIKEEIQNMRFALARVEKNWFPPAKKTDIKFLSSGYVLAKENNNAGRQKIMIYKPKNFVLKRGQKKPTRTATRT